MITVIIYINGRPIHARSAVNKGKKEKDTRDIYKMDDGNIILHKREDGAVKLSIEMLKRIKEL